MTTQIRNPENMPYVPMRDASARHVGRSSKKTNYISRVHMRDVGRTDMHAGRTENELV